ncbi:MAG: phytoene/squalene synthase family protein [Planctomycetota bacterium]
MSVTPLRPSLDVCDAAEPHANGAAEGFAQATEITRERARNFYYGLRLAPKAKRDALFALYAWMRVGDDIADDPRPLHERRSDFESFRGKSLRAFEGVTLSDDEPWWRAFADTCARFPLTRHALDDMLDGLDHDLDHTPEHRPFRSEGDVDRYCRQVGSSVGVLCVDVWGLEPGADPAHALALATRRGIAFQRTNILRDIAEDAAEGRCYLAADTLDRYNLSEPDLLNWSAPDACAGLVAELAATARAHYQESRGLENLIARDCVPVLRAMTAIYSGVLRCLERSPERAVLGPRARVSNRRKVLIATSAAIGRLNPTPWR